MESISTQTGAASPLTDHHPKLLQRKASAAYLTEQGFQTSPRTLAKLAVAGDGPAYRLFGRRALYAPADLLAWATSRLSAPRRHTSEPAPASRNGGEP